MASQCECVITSQQASPLCSKSCMRVMPPVLATQAGTAADRLHVCSQVKPSIDPQRTTCSSSHTQPLCISHHGLPDLTRRPLSPTPSPGPLYTHQTLAQDFPYYFEDDVTHWLLWNTCPLDTASIWTQVQDRFPQQQWEALMFVNPAALQSILSVRGEGALGVVWWVRGTRGPATSSWWFLPTKQ